MTLQEVFNNALFGVRAQKYVQSADELGGCLYRGPKGTECHIGHSIRDEDYQPDMERELISSQKVIYLFPGLDVDTLKFLQGIHDGSLTFGISMYEARMKLFAAEHKLEYKEP
jgi:hypothetical protein